MLTRNTIQKRLILETVKSLWHPSAEEVYQLIAETHPNISRGTIYRNLHNMVSLGELRQVSIPGMADRFDLTLAPHYHGVCRRCGALHDMDVPYQEHIQSMAASTADFLIDRHDIIFWGLCTKCVKDEDAGGF